MEAKRTRTVSERARRLPDLRVWLRSDGHPARLVAAGDGKARAELVVERNRPALPVDAGAILSLGNAAALAAGASVLDPPATGDPARLPRTIQLTLNLFRQACSGVVTAEAAVSFRTRSTLIVDVKVRDVRGNLIAAFAITQLAPESRDATLRLASPGAPAHGGTR